jgi:hypothetical protein
MLQKFLFGLGLLAAMTLSVHAFDDKAEAQKAIAEIASDLEAEKDVKEKVAALKKKIEELEPIMHSYKPKKAKGIGVGADGTGIEAKIRALSKSGITKDALAKEKADLLKMAYVNLAISHIAATHAPAKPKGGKGAKEWNAANDDMKKATMDLIKAVKGDEAGAIKKIATALDASCNKCHEDFR